MEQESAVAECEITVTEAKVCRRRNYHVSLFSSKTTICEEIHSATDWKRHPSEQVAVLHSVIVLYVKGCTTQVEGTEATVRSELKILNLDEGEATNSGTVRTAVPHKTTASRNIPAEFQEMLPEFKLLIIQKMKKKP